ncbi:restriction endonuclease subunit M [Nostoc sp.]|uniref:restriction endonuclease subunit M n=1 Tax=Nostoc sp. TaxID=1180 RepID=UPI003594275E
MNPLLELLGYVASDIKLKTSIDSIRVGQGRRKILYKPDYIVSVDSLPVIVIDAKSPDENIDNWVSQCSSYCLEINKLFDGFNPVKYFVLTNGILTKLFRWDQSGEIITLEFKDFQESGEKYIELNSFIGKEHITKITDEEQQEIGQTPFEFAPTSLDKLSKLFENIHQSIWQEEKKTPSAAFMELIKIIFVKLQNDKELRARLKDRYPKIKDIVFSKYWISTQTEVENPVNDILFKNLVRGLEREITEGTKKRFFDTNAEINLNPKTIEKIVEKLENIDLYGMEEDIHGRMFETFLDATVRGQELGQYFTPRDIVQLMAKIADPKVSKDRCDTVLDACSGSGGFLIAAMLYMLGKAENLVGVSNREKQKIKEKIRNEQIFGIDAGSDPQIYRIARMNMYLHGNGGSNIFFADSLNKSIGQIGRGSIEYDREIRELRNILGEKKFDIILSNPPFSVKYSYENQNQAAVLDQYELATTSGSRGSSLLSSVMFLERYKDLVAEDGKVLAIIDESVLSGSNYKLIRDYIRDNFIIKGIISLPGDAFKRSASRVKTSILILRLKQPEEIQSDVFMAKSVYLGLGEKIAKRLGISKQGLDSGKEQELKVIVENFKNFEQGISGDYVVPISGIEDRLDPKYCFNDNGRRKDYWISQNLSVVKLGKVLHEAHNRAVSVETEEEYQMLKINYGGEILDGDLKEGDDCSYSKLYSVRGWDILFSNMGVGRGAIGIVPPYHEGKFVSNEYTILETDSKEKAIYYTTLLRSKEILGDILSSTTGMNRGRIKWENMAEVEVPQYDPSRNDMTSSISALENLWRAYASYLGSKSSSVQELTSSLHLEDEDAKIRWLANKPPE